MVRVKRQKIFVYDERAKRKRKNKKTSIGSGPRSFGNGRNKHKRRSQKKEVSRTRKIMSDFCIETTAIHDEWIAEYNKNFDDLSNLSNGNIVTILIFFKIFFLS